MDDYFLDDVDRELRRKPLEASLESRLRTWCQDRGYIYLKNEGMRSFPDRSVIGPGWVVFLELKRHGEEPRKGQIRMLDRLSSLGHHAVWFDNFRDSTEYLTKIHNQHNDDQ